MRTLLLLCCLGIISAEQISFEDLIKHADRDYAVQAITRIHLKQDGDQWSSYYHHVDIVINGKQSIVTLSTKLMTGNKSLKLIYPTTERIKKEKIKIDTLAKLRHYQQKVADAQRKLRIFEHSNYALDHTSKLDAVLAKFGKPQRKTGHQKAGAYTLHYTKYDVEIDGQLLKDIVLK